MNNKKLTGVQNNNNYYYFGKCKKYNNENIYLHANMSLKMVQVHVEPMTRFRS